MSKSNIIAYTSLLLIIIVLSAILIFRKPQIIEISNQEQIYKDSVLLLQKNIELSHIRQDSLQKAYDSLLTIEPQVINRTREKVHYILTDATPTELDSIIRTSWKTKSRYR
jgi:cell envelope opacity-associated protein A